MSGSLTTAAIGVLAAFGLGVVALLALVRSSRGPDRDSATCPRCQSLVRPGASRCPHCGRPHP